MAAVTHVRVVKLSFDRLERALFYAQYFLFVFTSWQAPKFTVTIIGDASRTDF